MRTPKHRISPHVLPLESRALLAVATPVLNLATYAQVVADVRMITATYARTHDLAHAEAGLTRVASLIPYGRQHLAPVWVSDLAGAGGATRQDVYDRLVGDLNSDIRAEAAAGRVRIAGPVSGLLSQVGVSAASVTILNGTGFAITVQATLTGTNQTITRTIASGGSSLIDFNSSNTNYISVNVRNANGTQNPPPLTGYTLNRPISGYHGKSFTVSVFAGRFSMSV